MKRQSTNQDNLNSIERPSFIQKIAAIRISNLPLETFVFMFFLTSFAGWCWEVALFLIQEGDFCNRGFLHGPWLPVYGCGAIFIFLVLHRHRKNPFYVFFASLTIGTVVEYLIGWILEHFYHTRYWDYRTYFCNLNGYVCLLSATLFGLAGFFWVCIVAQRSADIWKKVPSVVRRWILAILTVLFLIDITYSCFRPNNGDNVNSPAQAFPIQYAIQQTTPPQKQPGRQHMRPSSALFCEMPKIQRPQALLLHSTDYGLHKGLLEMS